MGLVRMSGAAGLSGEGRIFCLMPWTRRLTRNDSRCSDNDPDILEREKEKHLKGKGPVPQRCLVSRGMTAKQSAAGVLQLVRAFPPSMHSTTSVWHLSGCLPLVVLHSGTHQASLHNCALPMRLLISSRPYLPRSVGKEVYHMPDVPGWNERLASDSEAVVKAEGSHCAQSIEELQRQTVEIVSVRSGVGLGGQGAGAVEMFWVHTGGAGWPRVLQV